MATAGLAGEAIFEPRKKGKKAEKAGQTMESTSADNDDGYVPGEDQPDTVVSEADRLDFEDATREPDENHRDIPVKEKDGTVCNVPYDIATIPEKETIERANNDSNRNNNKKKARHRFTDVAMKRGQTNKRDREVNTSDVVNIKRAKKAKKGKSELIACEKGTCWKDGDEMAKKTHEEIETLEREFRETHDLGKRDGSLCNCIICQPRNRNGKEDNIKVDVKAPRPSRPEDE